MPLQLQSEVRSSTEASGKVVPGGTLGSIVTPEKEAALLPFNSAATAATRGGGDLSSYPGIGEPPFILSVLEHETSIAHSAFCNFASNIPGTEGAGRIVDILGTLEAENGALLDLRLLGVRSCAVAPDDT